MKTLYVHIGMVKTGTTSIQSFCMQNRDALKGKSLCYPVFPYRYRSFPYKTNFKNANRNGAFLTNPYYDENGNRLRDEEKRIFSECMGKIAKMFDKCDNVLLSDEIIWTQYLKAKKDLWNTLLAHSEENGYVVKVIIYLRRQDDMVSSFWKQRVKTNSKRHGRKTWEAYLQDYCKDSESRTGISDIYLDYYEGLERISSIIGKENVIVRRFNRKNFKDGDIVSDFMDIMGIEPDDTFVYPNSSSENNDSFSENTAEIKRIINTIPDIKTSEHRIIRDILLDVSQQSPHTGTASLFSEEESKAFMSQFEAGNQKVAEEYICDGLPLFEEKKKYKKKWNKDDFGYAEDLLRFNTMLHVSMLRDINKTEKTTRRLKQMLKHPFSTVLRKTK